jgi:hypothetical protein
LPTAVQSRKEKIKQAKKENELRWYKSKFTEKEPEFKPLKKEGEVPYQLNKSTTVFAPPGTDINVLRNKYGL